MASRHLDSLVKKFISGSSDPYTPFSKFDDLQDPTFLSFRIDFFPDGGYSLPTDAYSSGGLFREAAGEDGNNILNYAFYDSAAEYLKRIGAPSRQAALKKFKELLFDIQEKAPWYFQQVSGLSELFKIDKNINFRGKDKTLTVECLESIDMRMTMLGDLYRFVAFDFQNWREVLPINLRTFNMTIDVLEMRKFNTTYGIIADALSSPPRPFKGEDKQKQLDDSARRNAFGGPGSSLYAGAFGNLQNLGGSINNALGGLFTNLGDNSGDEVKTYKEAFEAVSVQRFNLKDCEFDFFSEGPSYLDTVSVKDSQEATYKFKINVGKIEKVGYYTFYDYVLSEWTKNTRTPADLVGSPGTYSPPYFEPYDIKASDVNKLTNPDSSIRQSIFPDWRSQTDHYAETSKDSDYLRKKPLENALSSLIQNAVPQVNQALNNSLGKLTGGVLGTAPLGNVYSSKSFVQKAAQKLNDFLTPGNQLTYDQTSATAPVNVSLGKGILTGANPPSDPLGQKVFENLPKKTEKLPKDSLTGASPNPQQLPNDVLTGPSAVPQNLAKDTLEGAKANGKLGNDTNVFQ